MAISDYFKNIYVKSNVESTPQKKVLEGYQSERDLQTFISNRVNNISSSSILHENKSRVNLVNASREYYRNNSIYKGIINRITNYIVANGMKLNITGVDKATSDKIESDYKKYWDNPEIRNLFSGIKIEQLICKELLLCGDVGIYVNDNGKIQVIESEQITSKSIKNGIKTKSTGEYETFFVTPYKENGTLDYTKSVEIESNKMLFIADLERVSSLRGLPAFQSAFPILEHIDNVLKNESLAWDEITRFVAVIKTENSSIAKLNGTPGNNNLEIDRIINLDRGTFINAGNNESISGIPRDLPQNNLEQSLVCFLRLIGLPLNIPLEAILLDWTKSNYAQARAVLEQLYQTLRIYQDLLIKSFYIPLFKKWYNNFYEKDEINIDLDNIGIEFIPASFAWFDPLNEIKAQSEMRKLGINTYTEMLKSRGKEPNEIQKSIYDELINANNMKKQFKEETGIDLPLNIFAGLPLEMNLTDNQNKESIINE